MPRYLNDVRKTIGWADYTWNPVTGCLHNCEYCYARRMAKRFGKTEDEKNFKPAFHPERLDAPLKLKTPSRIFVCSNADLFCGGVLYDWIHQILEVCENNPQHKFLFLSKNPVVYNCFQFTENCWLGGTITNYSDRDRCEGLSMWTERKFLSIEPLLGNPFLSYYLKQFFNWIIVGAQTPHSAKSAPKPEWVQSIISFARKYETPLYLKDSLRWPETIKEFPEGLKLGGKD